MIKPAHLARKAAIMLASATRNADLSDDVFRIEADNCAHYYGINTHAVLIAFDDLSAAEFWGPMWPEISQPAKGSAPWL